MSTRHEQAREWAAVAESIRTALRDDLSRLHPEADPTVIDRLIDDAFDSDAVFISANARTVRVRSSSGMFHSATGGDPLAPLVRQLSNHLDATGERIKPKTMEQIREMQRAKMGGYF